MCVPTLRAVAVTDESVLGLRGSHVATLHTLNVRTSPESTGMEAVTTRGGGGGAAAPARALARPPPAPPRRGGTPPPGPANAAVGGRGDPGTSGARPAGA